MCRPVPGQSGAGCRTGAGAGGARRRCRRPRQSRNHAGPALSDRSGELAAAPPASRPAGCRSHTRTLAATALPLSRTRRDGSPALSAEKALAGTALALSHSLVSLTVGSCSLWVGCCSLARLVFAVGESSLSRRLGCRFSLSMVWFSLSLQHGLATHSGKGASKSHPSAHRRTDLPSWAVSTAFSHSLRQSSHSRLHTLLCSTWTSVISCTSP